MANYTEEQLRQQLEEAQARLAQTDQAIFDAGTDIDQDTLSDLEARFDRDEAEVKRISGAIDRKEREKVALQRVPRGGGGDDSGGGEPRGKATVINEPLTYRKQAEGGQYSFFQDLYFAQKGDGGAVSRLQRHQREMAVERRDMDTTGGTGGEFVPPVHLQNEWAELARAGRVFANAVRSRDMPAAGMSFTVPKVTTGTNTGVQAENSSVTESDASTNEITINVRTIAGQVDLSRQAFDRSEPGLDEVLFADLAADYATTLDTQLINGQGASATPSEVQGVLNNANINEVTYSNSTPSVSTLYPKVADAINQVHANRYMAPDAIFMHPRRWAFHLAALDNSDRPLITPYAPQNALARFDQVAPENVVGNLQGLTVFTDPNIPTNLGGGANEDAIIVTRLADNMLWETEPRTRVFESVGSNTLTVRLQVFGYVAYTSDRYGAAHTKITGSGLVPPSF